MLSSTRTAVSLVAIAAVGFGGCSVGRDDQPRQIDDPQVSSDRGGETSTRPLGPTFVVRGVPQGWRHDSHGARTAAVSAVSLTGQIARSGFIVRGDMIEQLATQGFASDLTETTDRQLADLAEVLGEESILPPQLTWAEIPLTARVVSQTTNRVVVEVWSVVVVATPDVGVPRQAWRTVTVELAWESDDWKVGGWAVEPGPTPALAPAAAISSTDELTSVADWPPAGPLGRDQEDG